MIEIIKNFICGFYFFRPINLFCSNSIVHSKVFPAQKYTVIHSLFFFHQKLSIFASESIERGCMGTVYKNMAKMANSTVGYIALLWQLASFARLGRRSLDSQSKPQNPLGADGCRPLFTYYIVYIKSIIGPKIYSYTKLNCSFIKKCSI